MPEQLAAGIHKLKFDEGMSSGGSSGFPSTPAPTPFTHHPGGVRPEDLAAGISRLSVIEESVVNVMEETNDTSKQTNQSNDTSQPDLSQYFGAVEDKTKLNVSNQTQPAEGSASFFDEINNSGKDAVLHSCRESRVDLSNLERSAISGASIARALHQVQSQARIDVAEQKYDDEESLQHRAQFSREHSLQETPRASESEAPSVVTIFKDEKPANDPFDAIRITNSEPRQNEEQKQPPSSLQLNDKNDQLAVKESISTPTASTAEHSMYSTPIAPTPVAEQANSSIAYSSHMTSTPNPLVSGASSLLQAANLPPHLSSSEPITSPLTNPVNIPQTSTPGFYPQLSSPSSADESLLYPDQV